MTKSEVLRSSIKMSYSGPRNANVRSFTGGINALEYWIGNSLLSARHILNDSTVTGTTVKAALDFLNESISNLITPTIMATLIDSITFTPAQSFNLPAILLQWTPVAGKTYKIEFVVTGNLATPGTFSLQMFAVSGSGGSYVTQSATGTTGSTSTMTVKAMANTSIPQMGTGIAYVYCATQGTEVLALRFVVSAGSNTFTPISGSLAVYETTA